MVGNLYSVCLCRLYLTCIWHACDKQMNITWRPHLTKPFPTKWNHLVGNVNSWFTSSFPCCLSSRTTTVTSSVAASLKSTAHSAAMRAHSTARIKAVCHVYLRERKLISLLCPALFKKRIASFEWWQSNMFKPAAFFSSCRWFRCSSTWVRERFPNNFPCLFYSACKTRWVEINTGNKYLKV